MIDSQPRGVTRVLCHSRAKVPFKVGRKRPAKDSTPSRENLGSHVKVIYIYLLRSDSPCVGEAQELSSPSLPLLAHKDAEVDWNLATLS